MIYKGIAFESGVWFDGDFTGTREQEECADDIRRSGGQVEICRSREEAELVLDGIGGGETAEIINGSFVRNGAY